MNVKKHVETDSYEIKLVKSAILATQIKKLLYQSKEQKEGFEMNIRMFDLAT